MRCAVHPTAQTQSRCSRVSPGAPVFPVFPLTKHGVYCPVRSSAAIRAMSDANVDASLNSARVNSPRPFRRSAPPAATSRPRASTSTTQCMRTGYYYSEVRISLPFSYLAYQSRVRDTHMVTMGKQARSLISQSLNPDTTSQMDAK